MKNRILMLAVSVLCSGAALALGPENVGEAGRVAPQHASLSMYILLGTGLLLYFVPTLIAAIRREAMFPVVFLVNFALGWTIVGWFFALKWAVWANPHKLTLDNPLEHHRRAAGGR